MVFSVIVSDSPLGCVYRNINTRYNPVMSFRVAISAGEVSGDQHLARVVAMLRKLEPTLEVRGMAGRDCEAAGAALEVDCYTEGSTMGFVELLRSLGSIRRSFRKMVSLLDSWKPDVLLIVDYPDFNLRLAKQAKRRGIPVVYYIPPKIWVWRSKRIDKIKKYVDKVAAIFPFEEEFYKQRGYSEIEFVGHPVAEHKAPLREQANGQGRRVLIMPGSRRFEVERILVPALQAISVLRQEGIELQPTVLLAPNMARDWIVDLLRHEIDDALLNSITWCDAEPLQCMASAHLGILKSGTCNLEAAIAGLPFVCVYSGSLIARLIVDYLIPLKEFSPVNIILPATVPELIQIKLSPVDIARELRALLEDSTYRAMVHHLERVSELLYDAPIDAIHAGTVSSVAERVGKIVIEAMKHPSPVLQEQRNV